MPLRLLLLFFLSLSLSLSAIGQTTARPADRPVRLVDIAAPSALEAGAIGHFRAQVAPESQRPVNYLWDLGDGTLSVGPLVSHVYAAPGTYSVSVTARNARGRDTLRTEVNVVVPKDPSTEAGTARAVAAVSETETAADEEDASAPAAPRVTFSRTALFGGGGVEEGTGGFTWVLASDLWEERARDRMLHHRLRGLRADVVVDTAGTGSPAYRVVAGQFATEAEALVARAWLPEGAAHAWLLELESTARAARP
jgi:hypothetical protein